MNVEELMKLKEEAKNMSEEEKREKVIKIKNARNENSSTNIENNNDEYIILENGLYDIGNLDVAIKNTKTKEQIESMVDTEGAIKEIESVIEQKTIELSNAEYTDHILAIDQLGCVVTKNYFLKASQKAPEIQSSEYSPNEAFSKIHLTKNDCLIDIVPIQFHYRPWNARINDENAPIDTREEPDFIPYESNVKLVHFNEFYKRITDLGYFFERGDLGVENGFETPYDEYIDLVSKGEEYNDIIVENNQDYYKGGGR